jgi:PIN domain nuclease of toxin-antitoxin system
MQILLDTCVFLWLTTDAPELSNKARVLFRNPENQIYLSCVSVWEMIVKNKLGKLPLPEQPENFISKQCRIHQIDYLGLDEKAVYQLQILPDLHQDPFDRMLICQALHKELTILISDAMIKQYSVNCIW